MFFHQALPVLEFLSSLLAAIAAEILFAFRKKIAAESAWMLLTECKYSCFKKIKDNIIQRTSGSSKKNLKFEYDASGNRVAKSSYTSAGVWIESTYYVRDAQGNVMSTYHENAQPGDVVDHDPPLVQRYYEGDPATGEKPGYLQTEEERKASAADRSRMKLQSQKDSNKQGGQMSNYSKQQKEKYQLNKKTDIY